MAAEKASRAKLIAENLYTTTGEAGQGEGTGGASSARKMDWLHAVIPNRVIIQALVEAYGGYSGYASADGPPKRALLPIGALSRCPSRDQEP